MISNLLSLFVQQVQLFLVFLKIFIWQITDLFTQSLAYVLCANTQKYKTRLSYVITASTQKYKTRQSYHKSWNCCDSVKAMKITAQDYHKYCYHDIAGRMKRLQFQEFSACYVAIIKDMTRLDLQLAKTVPLESMKNTASTRTAILTMEPMAFHVQCIFCLCMHLEAASSCAMCRLVIVLRIPFSLVSYTRRIKMK